METQVVTFSRGVLKTSEDMPFVQTQDGDTPIFVGAFATDQSDVINFESATESSGIVFSPASNMPNDPTFPGTRIPIFRVAALLNAGMTEDQLKEDFPSLSKQQIHWAGVRGRENPAALKKYPKKSFKRLLLGAHFHELERMLKKRRKR